MAYPRESCRTGSTSHRAVAGLQEGFRHPARRDSDRLAVELLRAAWRLAALVVLGVARGRAGVCTLQRSWAIMEETGAAMETPPLQSSPPSRFRSALALVTLRSPFW